MHKNKQIRVIAQLNGESKPQQRQVSPGGEISFYAPAKEDETPTIYHVSMPDDMSSISNDDNGSYF